MRLNVPKVKARIAGGSDPARILAKARGLYDGDVSYLDAALDRVLVRLDDDREKIETHVLVVSDHGESFGEAGSVGHGKRLTPEQIRVPCFVLSPRIAPGVSAEPVGTTDLTTTILALADVAADFPGGRDLLEKATAPTRVVGMRRTFDTPFRERRTDGSVHVLEGLRFYVLDGQDLVTGNGQGAVTLNDSSEELADPERAASARQLFAEFEEQFMAVTLRSRDDEETLKKLEALGYVR
jgi:arylsulfatase A-like enzyme